MKFKVGDRVYVANKDTIVTDAEYHLIKDRDVGTVIETIDTGPDFAGAYLVAFDTPRPWLHTMRGLGKEYDNRCLFFVAAWCPLEPAIDEGTGKDALDVEVAKSDVREETV